MTITDYLMNIALIALVVLQVRGHKITVVRLVVPIAMTLWAASQFLSTIPTAGNDLLLETALLVAGSVLGLSAGFVTSVRPVGGTAFAKAGATAAVLWVLGIGARMAFSIWVSSGGRPTVERFSALHHITTGQAWVAAFILMALAEVASRTSVLYLKAVRSGAAIPRGGLRQSSALA